MELTCASKSGTMVRTTPDSEVDSDTVMVPVWKAGSRSFCAGFLQQKISAATAKIKKPIFFIPYPLS